MTYGKLEQFNAFLTDHIEYRSHINFTAIKETISRSGKKWMLYIVWANLCLKNGTHYPEIAGTAVYCPIFQIFKTAWVLFDPSLTFHLLNII